MKNPLKRHPTQQIIYTPFDLADAVPAGRRRFWKQVLPVTTIDYKGHKVKFDKKYHMDLAQSFKGEAFDQVPVVFADGENRHNMDPRNFGGDVLDMQVRPQGLYALIEADKEAAKAIEKNPKLGVSARIRQAFEKADGRKFDRAIEHLCLTMNPRVTGMEPWQAVDLTDGDADIEVVDLTAETFEEGTAMAKTATTKKPSSKVTTKDDERTIDLSALTDEQFENLMDLAETLQADAVDEDTDEDVEDEVEEKPLTRRLRRKKSKTKITVEKDSEDEGDDDAEDDAEDDDADVSDLSDTDKVLRNGERSQFAQMRLDLAEEKWGRSRAEYVAAGVPPFLLDLAEPILSLPDSFTIDLSEDETLDASDTIRQMLDGVKGVIDMTDEIGHQIDLTGDEDDEVSSFLKTWDEQYG